MSMDICGGDGIYIPTTECDECDAFLSRLEQAEDNIEYLADHKQNNLVAGENITIVHGTDGDTISSSGGGKTYSAGTGISIDANDVISNTAPGVQYTAGTGISIDANNVISATGTSASTMTKAEMEAGTDTTGKLVKAKDLKDTYVQLTGDNITDANALRKALDIKDRYTKFTTCWYVLDGAQLAAGATASFKLPIHSSSVKPSAATKYAIAAFNIYNATTGGQGYQNVCPLRVGIEADDKGIMILRNYGASVGKLRLSIAVEWFNDITSNQYT